MEAMVKTYWISKTIGQIREARVRHGRATYTIGKDCWATREDALRRQADALEATPIAVHELVRVPA